MFALPSWVLLTQLFLALGWMRAATAHAISPEWWQGVEIERFLVDNQDTSLPLYEAFSRLVVDPASGVVAAMVVVAELVVGVALVADYRPTVALAVGVFLNVHFMAAGGVNPSVFYLILGLGLVAWHQEQRLTNSGSRQVTRRVMVLAAATTVLLAPQISTVAPANVIEDPAAVLVMLAWLVALAFLSISTRAGEPSPALATASFAPRIPTVGVALSKRLPPHPPRRPSQGSTVGVGLPGLVPDPERRRNLAPLGHGGSAEIDHGRSALRGLPGLLR